MAVQTLLTVALVCCIISIVLGMIHLFLHAQAPYNHKLKTCVLIILGMIPVYAIDTMVCLGLATSNYHLPELATLVREIYEGVVVVAFVRLILLALGGSHAVTGAFCKSMQRPTHVWVRVGRILAKKTDKCKWMDSAEDSPAFLVKGIPQPFTPGLSFVSGCLTGVLQYSFVSFGVCALDALSWLWVSLMQLVGAWEPAAADEKLKAYMKFPQLVKTGSIGLAMYCLFLLLLEIERNEVLKPVFDKINPEEKFLCIKVVVFATALQKVFCEKVLPFFGVFEDEANAINVKGGANEWTAEKLGTLVQNLLLAVELPLFAIWHFRAYKVTDWGDVREEERTDSTRTLEESPNPNIVAEVYKDIQALRKQSKKQRELTRVVKEQVKGDNPNFDGLQEMFNMYDLDKSGQVSIAELKWMLEQTDHTEDEIDRLAKKADPNKDGDVSFDEFKNAFKDYAPPVA